MATTRAMQMLNEFPKPTIALVHGACFGGGCGLVCCVDLALATPDAIFGLTSCGSASRRRRFPRTWCMRWGCGTPAATPCAGERFDAAEALRIGLVHEIVPADSMDAKLAAVLDAIFLGAPEAIAVTKRSFLGANGLLLDERQMSLLAHESWTQRHSGEGHEGTAAFREKRKPS